MKKFCRGSKQRNLILKTVIMAVCLFFMMPANVSAAEIGSVRTDIEAVAGYDSYITEPPELLGDSLLVHWQDLNTYTYHYSLVNPDGTVSAFPGVSISPKTNNNSDTIVYKGLSSGNWLVCWYSSASSTGLTDTYFKIIDKSGNSVVASTKINSAAGELNRFTECAELSNGDIAFIWATDGKNIALRRFTQAGTAVDASQISVTDLSGTAGYSQYDHHIAASQDGRFMIVTECYKDNNYRGMIFGNTSATPIQVGGQNAFIISSSGESSGGNGETHIEALSNGRFLTVYRKITSGDGNTANRGIAYRIYNTDGTTCKDDTTIRRIHSWGTICEPAVVNGNFYLQYIYNGDSTGSTMGTVYYEYYDNDGNYAGDYSVSLPAFNGVWGYALPFRDIDGNLSLVINDTEGGRADYDIWLLRTSKVTPTISTWPTISAITCGQTFAAAMGADGSANVAGAFSIEDAATAPGAGTYSKTITFIPNDTTKYNTVTQTFTVTVNKVNPTVSTWPTISAITCGQTFADAMGGDGLANVAGTFSIEDAETEPGAGTYSKTITFIPNDTAKYNNVTHSVSVTVQERAVTPTGSVTINANGTIKKDAVIILSSEAGATIYYTTALNGDTPAVPDTSSSSVSNGGEITYPVLTYGDILKIKAFSVVPGKWDSTPAEISYTVQSKTELKLIGIILSSKVYDGSTSVTADFGTADIDGIIGTDDVELSGIPNASFLTPDAADGKTVTVQGYSLAGADTGYYTLNTTLSNTANITKKALTLGTIVIADKEYDGNNTATVLSIPISNGIVGLDEVSVNIPLAAAAFENAGVEADKAVTVIGIQLKGTDSANYSVPLSIGATGDITQKTVSAGSVTIANKPYDGNTTAAISGAALTGKVGAEDVTIDYSGAAATFNSALVGDGKTVTVTGLKLGGSDKANYVLDSSSFTATGNITSLGTVAAPTASIADRTVVKSGVAVKLATTGYNGAALHYTIGLTPADPTSSDTTVASGDTVTIAGNPGDEIVLKVFGTKEGYEDSTVAIFRYYIQSKCTLTIAGASAGSKDYDGTRIAAVSGGTLGGSVAHGDAVTLDASAAAGQFADKNEGKDKVVTVSGYSLTGVDAIYYDLIQPTLTADIRKKNITPSAIVINDKVYDGSISADISSVTLSWKAAGDEVYIDISAATAVFDDTSLGNGKNVNIKGLELAGADSGNYQLVSTTAAATGNIIPAGTVATPAVSPVEGSILSGAHIILSDITSGAAIYFTLDGSEPTTGSSQYINPIPITGEPGTTVTVKAIAAKVGMTDSGTLTKHYTIAAPGSLTVTSTPDNQKITLTWDAIPGTVTYAVYDNGGNYLGDGVSAAGGTYEYTAAGLNNGTTYTFTVKALNAEACVTNSAQISATPRTVPGAPTNVTASAGNGQAVISFTAPSDNGGSNITGYIVTSNPGNITVNGASSPITATGLTNGTAYTFTVKAVNIAGSSSDSSASGTVTPLAPSTGGSNPDSTGTTTSTTEVLINGQVQSAGTTTIKTVGDQIVTTITVDGGKIEEILNKEGNNVTVTMPVNNSSDVVVGVLNGQTVKNMEEKEATLEIKTENVTYTIPASEINIDDVSSQIGGQVALKDIKISISVAEPPANTVKIVEDSADKNNYRMIVKPIEFEITCTSGNRTVNVSKFNSYVERMVAIPDGVDPSKITTGVVLNNDGTFSHVPTTIVIIDGKYYAKINSLTNSTYSVIWNPKTFKDVQTHWAKDAINDLGTRLVISGVGGDRFEPDSHITRAEFAAIIVRALGLMRPGTGKDVFDDVTKDSWYYDAVYIAYDYGIIAGYGNDKFGPMDKITREQAMSMVAKAMKITGLKAELNTGETDKLLDAYGDSTKAASWAKDAIASCIKTEIVTGRSGKLIAPKENITRAEVTVIVRKLLQKSKLI